MKNRIFKNGFTVTEVLIGSLVISIVILGIVRVLGSHVTILQKSAELTKASVVAEDVSSRIKAQPFDSVFSFDSKDPHPKPLLFGKKDFDPAAYMIDIDSSPMKSVLDDIVAAVKDAGFERVRIDVVYLRRNSSAQGKGGDVDQSVEWSNTAIIDGLVKYGLEGCDFFDQDACFRDLNNDGDYWDVVDGVPETPYTGLKRISVSIYKAGGKVMGVKHGTLLTKGGFSGEEIRSGQAPLKLKISTPVNGMLVFQVTPKTRSALQLPTRRTYPANKFHDLNNENSVWRIDNWNKVVTLNKLLGLDGSNLGVAGVGIAADERFLRVRGTTDKGESGHIQIFEQKGPAIYPQKGEFHEEKDVSAQKNTFEIYKAVGNRYELLSGEGQDPHLMRDGIHRLYIRKQAIKNPTLFSPYDVRIIKVDTGIPKLTYNYISENVWPYGGLTPVMGVSLSDYFQGDGVTPAEFYSGVEPSVVSAILMPTDNKSIFHGYVRGKGDPVQDKDYNMSFSQNYATSTCILKDSLGFPWELKEETTYNLTWEWGDKVGYKSSHTFTFTIPKISGDETPPEINVRTDSVWGAGTLVILKSKTADPFPVVYGKTYNLYPLMFSDPESGINHKKIKIEICEDKPLQAMNLDGDTADCKTIYHFAKGVRWDKSANWGDQFYYTPKYSHSTTKVVLSSNTYPVGSTWRLRAYAENWAGRKKTTDDDYWRIQIVSP